jgi:hypothetical protein
MKNWTVRIVGALSVVTALSAFLVWRAIYHQPVDRSVERGVRKIVQAKPSLQPMLDVAMEDGVLTMSEASAIIEAAKKEKS